MRRSTLGWVALAMACVGLACAGPRSDDLVRGESIASSEPAARGRTHDGGAVDGGVTLHDAGAASYPRLPEVAFAPYAHARGSGLSLGIVSGRIYDDLAKNTEERMRDFAALGVRILRIEIERATPVADYAKIAVAAKAHGIELLALITQNSLQLSYDPMAGTRADFDALFVPKVIAAIDAITALIPSLRYVEVWNEPDVYAFSPFFTFTGGTCTPLEGSFRYALLTVRVFETMHERRKLGLATPTLVGFDFSHQDDTCVLQSVADAQPIAAHRAGYRVPNGLPDGLPTDIVSIHGYGLPNRIPGEAGYTYAGGTFADGVTTFLGHTFADGRRMIGASPVWYTEVGFCLSGIGGPDPLERQKQAVTGAVTALRAHPEITAAFMYSYRDDEGTGGERCGLRDSSTTGFAAHPAYEAFQAQAALGNDVAGPGGALEPTGTVVAKPGTTVALRGWAIDPDGQAPSVSIAIDGAVVASVVDGASPHAAACKVAHSSRCPNVGFVTSVVAPAQPGLHEVAARATDAKGNARVLGRLVLDVRP